MKNTYYYFLSTLLMFVSGVSSVTGAGLLDGSEAEIGKPFTGLTNLVNRFLIPLLLAVAFLMFIYGIFLAFIAGGSDPEKRKEGRNLVIYSIIGFVLIFSLWGIVAYLSGALFNGTQAPITLPVTPAGLAPGPGHPM